MAEARIKPFSKAGKLYFMGSTSFSVNSKGIIAQQERRRKSRDNM
ncbi:hypothetical protein [uncultured Subdoligranulum sp.]|nr:hypothetical protein [uncultured Subdoligranulum sp.]